jgi:uncharacterized membrane protein (UPF0127 family)
MPNALPLFRTIRTRVITIAQILAIATVAAAPLRMAHAESPSTTSAKQVIQLTAGLHLIQAEVADTPALRQQGLMHRKGLRPNSGMLFVFDEKAGHCFWMKNTPLPLTIAFLADNGEIVNLADMQPHSEQNHCPRAPIRYALEMQQGWFQQRGIKPGTAIGGLPQQLR